MTETNENEAQAGGVRPYVMRSIQFAVSEDVLEAMLRIAGTKNRSEAARAILGPIIKAHHAEIPGLRSAIRTAIEQTRPSGIRQDEVLATQVWGKQIVWIPLDMLVDLRRIARQYDVLPSAFARGAIFWAMTSSKKPA